MMMTYFILRLFVLSYLFFLVDIETMRQVIAEVVKPIEDALKPMKDALKHTLELVLDPWEQIHSEVTEIIEAESNLHLDNVSDFYSIPKNQYCMVLGKVTYCHVICAHIWPKCTMGKGLDVIGLERRDINSPRNFLRLHKSIENAFDKKRLYFSYIMEGDDIRFVVKILDPTLLQETLTVAKDTTISFASLQDVSFHYKFVLPCKPFLRTIVIHAMRALENAKAIGWVDGGDFPARRERLLDLARLSLEEPALLNIF
jgi:hypothetical protein